MKIKGIKMKFTKASSRDDKLITLNLSDIGTAVNEYNITRGWVKTIDWSGRLNVGSRLIVEVKSGKCVVPLLFTVNRYSGSRGRTGNFSGTATTKSWPFNNPEKGFPEIELNTPYMGQPVFLEVVSIEIIESTTTIFD